MQQEDQAPQETPQNATSATPTVSPKETSKIPSDERLLAALGYIPMLFVGPLTMKPKSTFCQIHGKQGLLLTMLTFVVLFILVLIPAIGSLLFLALIGLIAIAGFQAYSGVEWKIPYLYEVASKLNMDQLFAGTTIKPVPTEKSTPQETPTPPSPEAPASKEEPTSK